MNLHTECDESIDSLEYNCKRILNGETTIAEVTGFPLQHLDKLCEEGLEAWKRDDNDLANSIFFTITLIDNKNAQFAYAYGCFLKEQGMFDHALGLLKNANIITPNNPYVLFHMASCFVELKESQLARDYFNLTIELCFHFANDNDGCDTLKEMAFLNLNKLAKGDEVNESY